MFGSISYGDKTTLENTPTHTHPFFTLLFIQREGRRGQGSIGSVSFGIYVASSGLFRLL